MVVHMKQILACLTIGLFSGSFAHANDNFVCQNQMDQTDRIAMSFSQDSRSIIFDKAGAEPEFNAGPVAFLVQFTDKTFSCVENVRAESLESLPLIEAGWKVTSHEPGVYYDPPVIQRKSRGIIEEYAASDAARHMRKGCRLVSHDPGVIYDPPIVRCKGPGYIQERSAARLPGMPF